MPDAAGIVREVAAASALVEGADGVRSVVRALARLEPVSTRRLSLAVELPVPVVASVCGELRRRGIVAERRPNRLTPGGRALFGGAGGLSGGGACRACSGRGVAVGGTLAALRRELGSLAREAPGPRLELDQCHCTVETKLRRLEALHEGDALAGRRLLLLGDDDLLSLALVALARAGGSSVASLTVVDVDPELLAFLEPLLASASFPAELLAHDVRDPLPRRLRVSFDTVATDPPYTVPAARLFLSRAAEAIDGGGTVLLSFGSRRPGAALGLQRAIVEIGFTIRRLVPHFNEYVGAGTLGGTSHLYHLVAGGPLRPLVPGRFGGPLYTAEVKARASSSRLGPATA